MLKYLRGEYVAGGTAIRCVDEDGLPYAYCSVCLADYGLIPPEDEIVVPVYKMMPYDIQTIVKDLAKEELGFVHFGYGTGLRIRLRDDWREFCEEIRR